jgi:GT2 family glycosyltransferase
MVRVGLVLVAYENSLHEISRTLDGWGEQHRPPDVAYVVANSPVDGFDTIASRATLLDPSENLGFATGVNRAAELASNDGCTHILLSNLDVRLLSQGIVERLLQAVVERPDALAMSPGISLWPDTSAIWYRGAHVSRPAWISRQPGLGTPWVHPTGAVEETGYFSGCCALVDLVKFNTLGGFDEELFMYYDEADLAERARDAGWRSYVVDEPLVAHDKPGRRFNPTEAFYHARNSAILLGHHEQGLHLVLGRGLQLMATPLQLLRCQGQEGQIAYLRGLAKGTLCHS